MSLLRKLEKLIEALVAAQLLVTVVLVFLNVMLRYLFNSGIAVTDEISRILLGSLIFTGATIALAQGRHIGMTLVVEKLPLMIQKLVVLIAAIGMLLCDVLLVDGAWQQAVINVDNSYPLSGLSSSIPYFIAAVCGSLMGIMTLSSAILALTNRIPVLRFFARLTASDVTSHD